MSAFLTNLIVKEVTDDDAHQDGRSTWQLLFDLIYQSDHLGGLVTVPAGFVTDFASVPRIPVAYLLAGGEANEAAVVHDYLYHSHTVPRADADAVFREAMGVTGQPWWRRQLMWAGVRLFGGRPYADDFADQSKGDSP